MSLMVSLTAISVILGGLAFVTSQASQASIDPKFSFFEQTQPTIEPDLVVDVENEKEVQRAMKNAIPLCQVVEGSSFYTTCPL